PSPQITPSHGKVHSLRLQTHVETARLSWSQRTSEPRLRVVWAQVAELHFSATQKHVSPWRMGAVPVGQTPNSTPSLQGSAQRQSMHWLPAGQSAPVSGGSSIFPSQSLSSQSQTS